MNKNKQASPFSKLWGWASPYHSSFILAVLLAILGVACSMIPYFCAAYIVSSLLKDTVQLSLLIKAVSVASIGYIGKVIFSCLSTTVSHTATYHTLRDIRKKLISKLSRVPMGTILNTPSGTYKTTIVDRVEGMEPTLAHLIPEMTSNLLVPITIAAYIFILDWRMGFASLITTAVGIFIVCQSSKTYASRWEGAVKIGKTMSNAIVEYVGGIQVVKAFSQSAGSYKKYSNAVNDNAEYYVDWMGENQKYMCLWQSIIPAVLVSVLPVGYYFWFNGSLSPENYLTIIILSLGLTSPLIAAMSFVDDLAVVDSNVKEISSILDAEELIRPKSAALLKDKSISLKNVTFGYENSQDKVLKNINLKIKPNTVTALVGPSGSGKSTIAKLIAGFWDVDEGAVNIGGTNIKNIPFDQLNKEIAYVSQDNYLFNLSVRDNIRMGKQDASDLEVEYAAKSAGCDSFIKNLTDGYDTVAGGGGGHLSGGEKQRISIARAMLKNAPIIILDEATASIDPENEAIIQNALSKLIKNKTLIVIAHRLSTIADADNIVVIKDGNIVDQGTQQELLNRCSLYADMWHAHITAKDKDMKGEIINGSSIKENIPVFR